MQNKQTLATGIWRRIGDDGLPPLASEVTLDGKVVARIVDETPYRDECPTALQPPGEYAIEWLTAEGEWLQDSGTVHSSFEAAIMAVHDGLTLGGPEKVAAA